MSAASAPFAVTPQPPARSPWKIAMRRLRRHKLALVGLAVLVILYLTALFADFIAPYRYDSEDRQRPYLSPDKIRFLDEKGFSWQPFVFQRTSKLHLGERIEKIDTSKRFYIRFFVKGEPYKFLGLIRSRVHLFGTDAPSGIHLLGSDWNGRDIFSRVCHGARVSLSVGLIGVFISFTLGMIIGGVSGYFGGITDTILMRLVELLMSFPSFFLLLSLTAALPRDLTSIQRYLLIVVILSFLSWPGLARVIRGMVLSLKEEEYALAARAVGAGSFKIITKHILPNTFSYAIVAATLRIPGYIISESALSLLGLGINEPQPSWGNMLSQAMSPGNLSQYPWIIVPGFFIFFAIMAFNLLGDGLRDAFDPKGLTSSGKA
ncbi:MAG: ABC transporter permease [bacterium]|nr:ABC transporter permease [bacterium]